MIPDYIFLYYLYTCKQIYPPNIVYSRNRKNRANCYSLRRKHKANQIVGKYDQKRYFDHGKIRSYRYSYRIEPFSVYLIIFTFNERTDLDLIDAALCIYGIHPHITSEYFCGNTLKLNKNVRRIYYITRYFAARLYRLSL